MLLKQNYQVIGIDNLNDYYDPKLKQQNLDILNKYQNLNQLTTLKDLELILIKLKE